jgi:hypothetical protein
MVTCIHKGTTFPQVDEAIQEFKFMIFWNMFGALIHECFGFEWSFSCLINLSFSSGKGFNPPQPFLQGEASQLKPLTHFYYHILKFRNYSKNLMVSCYNDLFFHFIYHCKNWNINSIYLQSHVIMLQLHVKIQILCK